MSEYKYKFGNGLAFYESKDMLLLEEMAAEGYALVSINCFGFYKFEKSQPEDCIYSVDYSDIKPNEDEFNHYKEIFESSGWKHVYSNDTFHYFKAPKGTTPIYTDNDSLILKHEKMRRFSIHFVLASICIAIVSFALSIIAASHTILVLVFLGLMGGAIGLAIAMGIGVSLNSWRISQLRNSQTGTAPLDTDNTSFILLKSRKLHIYGFIACILVITILFILRNTVSLPDLFFFIPIGASIGLSFVMAWNVISDTLKISRLEKS